MTKIILSKKDNELSYMTVSDSYVNKNTLDIWIKFISYLNEDEIAILNNIKDKDIRLFSQDDLDKYYKIKTQLNMSELFEKYKNRECTKEEHDKVFEFMKNNSLKSFVRKKINIDDRFKAYKFIGDLAHESKDNLKEYIDLQESKYDELSVYNAYILFEAKETLYSIEQEELNDKIRKEIIEREINLRRSLYKDYGLI